MQASTSTFAGLDKEETDLTYLLDVFSSSCSLEDIASAYVKAKHNVEMAGEILCTSHLCTSDGASSSKPRYEGTSQTFSDGLAPQMECPSLVHTLSSDRNHQRTSNGVGNTTASKSKRPSASMGTVSGMIGKDYTHYSKQKTSTKEFSEMQKPLKLELKEMCFSAKEEVPSSFISKNSRMNTDLEEFLFKMLGDGFELDMNVIKEVLGSCGYDTEKSIDKLLFMSASTLENSDDLVSLASSKSTEKCSDQHCAHRNAKKSIEEGGSADTALEKEVLEALFCAPKPEEPPKVSLPSRRPEMCRYKGYHGNLVAETFRETTMENKIAKVLRQEDTRAEAEDVENSYEILRYSVKEYWITMKEYYKSAFDAFSEGDHVLADKFLEKGHFFSRKAREADERLTKNLLKTRDNDGDSVSLDLHDHEPKEALRTLRDQLTYLSGMPAFKYLRIIVGSNDQDTTRGARRRMIVKQLEKESIKWTEEKNGQIIFIRLDLIDPKRLSFSKKSSERIQKSPSYGL